MANATRSRVCLQCGDSFIYEARSGCQPGFCSPGCKRARRAAKQRARARSAVPCSLEHCQRNAHALGLCPAHYSRLRSGRDLYRPLKGTVKGCAVADCDRRLFAKSLCALHYGRYKKTGDAGPANLIRRHGTYRWRDPRSGYVYVDPGLTGRQKRMLEHRFVMEEVLGRPLERYENVHHLNGIRDDNRPENLELWTKPQAAGQRVEDVVAWVVEHYPEQVRAALVAS